MAIRKRTLSSGRSGIPLLLAALLAGARDGNGAVISRPVEPVVVAGSRDGAVGAPLFATLRDPEGLAVDSTGRLFVADRDTNTIHVFELPAGQARAINGPGPLRPAPVASIPPGGPLGEPQHVAVDPMGGLVFAQDEGRFGRRYDFATGSITVVGGTYGETEFAGDGGPATKASLRVQGLACDREGNVYVSGTNRIRRISWQTGRIETVAGTGKFGFFGDGGPALAADLARPSAIAVDRQGTIYFSDGPNNRIRAVDRKGIIRTVAGNGRSGPPEDGDALRGAAGPVVALAVDPDGDVVFVTEFGFVRRLLVARGVMETFAQDLRWPEMPHPREVSGVAATADGSILFVVPRSRQALSIPGERIPKKAASAGRDRP